MFAPNARGRAALTGNRHHDAASDKNVPPPPRHEMASPTATPPSFPPQPPPPQTPGRPRRLPWADLLRRVHRLDVLRCSRCAGPRRVLAVLTGPDVTTAILRHLGLPDRPPHRAPARAPPAADEPADFGGWRDDDDVQPPAPDVLESP